MFALCRPKRRGLLQGEHPEILAQSDPHPCWFERRRHSIANCGWIHIAQRSQWRAYRKPPSLFQMVPSLTPYDLPFPQNGGSICPQDTWMAISSQRVIRYTSCLVLGYGFQGRRIKWRYFRLHQIQVGSRPPSWIISNGHISTTAYSIHLYSAHHVVMFAIAQLSCNAFSFTRWSDMTPHMPTLRVLSWSSIIGAWEIRFYF